ncbi:AAA family ATPase [Acinetobacter sp. NIPH1876]|uniref:AAA family ATPase n=1 Tax=unclassified Acinetobacter TaxID=196816 RepID=UPI001FAE546F|nr:AAA family ATPase [Acinetobacter sp. NIPH1876]MCJ0829168.1 AAA family ATPase [Acinetobacter sp. NIPH1876]
MSARHLLSNALSGNFEAAVQVFLNYKDGAQDFEKNDEEARLAFEHVVKTLKSSFYLNEITIYNFKKILDFKMKFHQNLIVFVGENGVGKTSLLEAIRRNLMWIAATTRKENTNGGSVDKDEINNNNKEKGAYIDCDFKIGSISNYKGRLACPPDGIPSNLKSELTMYRELGRNFRILNDYADIDLPLFSYYGIDRLQITGRKTKKMEFGKIDAYDQSLNDKATFSTFVDWLIQILKISKKNFNTVEKIKIESQIEVLVNAGANIKDNPLYEVYEDLMSILKLYPNNATKNKSKKTIELLEDLFRKIYPSLTHIQLVNEDDGKDKVVLNLGDQSIYLHQFSDGQRVLLGLIGDIARRLILLNDSLDNPFLGQGIVLIDEIELHLHPSWQQKVVLILRQSFPNIQFIVTTHSPHVITTVEPECIRSIYMDSDRNKYSIPNFTKGAESNVVLENVFYVDSRPQDVDEVQWLERYIKLVNEDQWDSEEAESLRHKLDVWGKNKEIELDKLDIEISLKKLKRLKK